MQIRDINKIFFSQEPAILMVGSLFKVEDNKQLIDLPWNGVYSLQMDNQKLIEQLNQGERLCRVIHRPIDLNNNALNARNLKVVELFPTTQKNMSIVEQLEQKKNAIMLLDKIEQTLHNFGKLIVIGLSEQEKLDAKELGMFFSSLRDETVIYIGEPEKNIISEVLLAKKAQIEQRIIYNEQQVPQEDYEWGIFDDVESEIDISNRIYINNRMHVFEKKDLFQINNFAQVLEYANIYKTEVPTYLCKNYFYAFLKNSANEPQWYGYRYGFNLVRDYEKKLYKVVKSALEKPNSDKIKPILLVGNTGSGKTIALSNLAYRIFIEKQYPVIYINNMELEFNIELHRDGEKVERVNSQKFEYLDELLTTFKEHGAKNTLIIWDGSAYIKDRDKYISLFEALRIRRGHNVVLVGSAYQNKGEREESKFADTDSEKNVFYKVEAPIEITGENNRRELEALIQILRNKAGMNQQEINNIVAMVTKENNKFNNLMALLYTLFYDIRNTIEAGVQREAEKTVQEVLSKGCTVDNYISVLGEAMKRAGIVELLTDFQGEKVHVDIKDFLISVAICSKYNLSIPSSMAFRLLEINNGDVIRKVLQIPFFEYEESFDQDFKVRIRTKLEAEILLKAYKLGKREEIDYVAKLIGNIADDNCYNQRSEINTISTLLYRMGPNAGVIQENSSYNQYYEEIVNALKTVREDKKIINPSLGLQEITYMREYVIKNDLLLEKKVEILKEAIRIGDELLGVFSRSESSINVLDSLAVEVANSRLRLCEFDESFKEKEIENGINNTLEVIARNPESMYAYHAYLELSLMQYGAEKDKTKKLEILAGLCDVVDRIREEHLAVAANQYFVEPADRVYEYFDDIDKQNEYFEELIAQHNYAGIYIRVKKMLREQKIQFMTKEDYSEEQINCMIKVCQEYLEKEEYSDIVLYSYQCQYLLLKLKWIIYNKKPMFYKTEMTTSMTVEQWEEIKKICEHYVKEFVEKNVVEMNNAYAVKYILALAYAQLGDFEKSMEMVWDLRDNTEWYSYNNRTRVLHFICEPNGELRTFSGCFCDSTDTKNETGYIKIDDIKAEWNRYKEGIYFHKHNIRKCPIESGVTRNDFQLGLAYMGFSVYYSYKVKGDE